MKPRGAAAEEEVERALVARGWSILERRLHVGRLEIDLLARRDDVVAVVEVRGRREDGLESPFDSIDVAKRNRLRRAAKRLWSSRFAADESVRVIRIDIAAVRWRADAPPEIEIVEGGVDLSD